jgi:hypothetical protein
MVYLALIRVVQLECESLLLEMFESNCKDCVATAIWFTQKK